MESRKVHVSGESFFPPSFGCNQTRPGGKTQQKQNKIQASFSAKNLENLA
jgi:hypothetical protein